MLKAMLVLSLAIVLAGLGNLCLAKGMQTVGPFETGPLENWALDYLLGYFFRAFANPWIILGIFLELAYFSLWLVVLSLAEVSWAVPMNGVEYLFVALLAVFWLGEPVSFFRWIGIVLISLGVFFMMKSWRTNEARE